jgi:hypothetical protein
MQTSGYFENTYVFSRYVLGDDPLPQLTEIRRAVESIGTKASDFSGNHVAGWAHALVAAAALKKCGFPCDGKMLNMTLSDLSVDVGPLTGGPIAFKGDDHQGISWWAPRSERSLCGDPDGLQVAVKGLHPIRMGRGCIDGLVAAHSEP